MSAIVTRYDPARHEPEWERFVKQANNGTIFHLRRFLSYHPQDRFQDHSLLFHRREELLAVLPAAELTVTGQRRLLSHPGASYGGLVTPLGLSFANTYRLVEALIDYLHKEGLERLTLTLPPSIYQRRPSDYVRFALSQHGFVNLKDEVSSVLLLESTLQANLAGFTPASRRAVNKARQAGVRVRFTDEWATFYHILLGNLKRRHNVQPSHSLDELRRLQELFPQRVLLMGAYLHGRMIAGMTIFTVTSDVALVFYISHDEAYQRNRAVNLLFEEIIQWGLREKLRYLDLGIFTLNQKPNFNLGRFKESFGATGAIRPTLTIDLASGG